MKLDDYSCDVTAQAPSVQRPQKKKKQASFLLCCIEMSVLIRNKIKSQHSGFELIKAHQVDLGLLRCNTS